MACDIEIINPIQHHSWNDMLLTSRDYSFFHSSNWAAVLHESYNYVPLYFTLSEPRQLKALIPLMEIRSVLTGKRAVSLPFSDYCEPIFTEVNCAQKLKDAIQNYAAKARWKYIEMRGGEELANTQTASITFYKHTLKLSNNEKQTLLNFRDSTKRNIKKAIKENVTIEITKSLKLLGEFYRLNCLTRKNHGLPPQPLHFFEKIYEHIITKNLGVIVSAKFQGQVIAAAIYFHFGKKAIYKYGASDKSYQHLRANNLVMWEAIKWYSQKGYKSLCFGRTELNHTGLRQFKVGWGTQESLIKYYKYDLLREKYIKNDQKLMSSYHRAVARMPIPLLKLAGSLLYKHMG